MAEKPAFGAVEARDVEQIDVQVGIT